ncbi:MAG: SdrD B-like domain-containing protein, partial [Pseudomonadota bacterium]
FSYSAPNRTTDDLDSDLFQSTGMSGVFHIANGQTIDVDGGIVPPAQPQGGTFTGRVWRDEDDDGVQDGGEPGVPGVTVQLKDAAGNVLRTTTTDANGTYTFTDVPAGGYIIGVLAPDGFSYSAPNRTTDDLDSDLFQSTGMSGVFHIANGQTVDIDGGIVPPAQPQGGSIGDRVWFDTDRDGVQDAGENGAAGVTVQLKDAAGNVLQTTTTDANGNYLFDNLDAGQYTIGVIAPTGFDFTTANASGNGQRTLTVESSEEWEAIGVRTNGADIMIGEGYGEIGKPSNIEGLTFNSNIVDTANGVGVEIPVGGLAGAQENVRVDLTVFKQWATRYGGDGSAHVVFELVNASGAVVDRVDWRPAPGSFNIHDENDTRNDETVTLEGAGQNLFVRVTDQSTYINDIRPGETIGNDVWGDDFVIDRMEVTASSASNNDDIDSDVNVTTGMTGVINLAQGQNITNVDAGLVSEPAPAGGEVIGGVWIDEDRDGVRESGETIGRGVEVQLKDAAGNVLRTTLTDYNGAYRFTDVPVGNYSVGVVAPNGFSYTVQNAAAENVDSDISQTTGMSDVFSVSSGQTVMVDGGLVRGGGGGSGGGTGSIGDRVWLEADCDGIQDAHEVGAAGVTVQLKDAAGNVLQTTTTDANGNYLFDNLPAGNYSIGVIAPAGFRLSRKDALAPEEAGEVFTVDTTAEWQALGVRNNGAGVKVGDGYNEDLEGITFNSDWQDSSNGVGVEIPLRTDAGNSQDVRVDLTVFKNWASQYGGDGSAQATFELVDQNGAVVDTVSWTSKANTFDIYDDSGNANDEIITLEGSGVGLFVRVIDQSASSRYGDDFVVDAMRVETKLSNPGGVSDTVDSDFNPATGMTDVFALAEGEHKTNIDAGLHRANGIEATIRGATSITESEVNDQYRVELSAAVQEDTWITVSVNSMTARQSLSFGLSEFGSPYFANSTHTGLIGSFSIGELVTYYTWDVAQNTGAAALVNDFVIFDQGGNFVGDTEFRVLVKAGQSVSETFSVGAVRESAGWGDNRTVPAQVVREGTESFSLEVTGVEGYHDCFNGGELVIHINDVPTFTPIALDLNRDGEIGVTGETSSRQKDADAELGRTVEFDIDADGDLEVIEWFDGSGDGILVDTRKIGADGEIDGEALFGDQGGKYANGYEKLALLDGDSDGVLTGAELEGLGLWLDDGDGVLEEGELQTLEQHDIASISAEMTVEHDSEGRELQRSTVTTSDGETILTEDVYFAAAQNNGDTAWVDGAEEDTALIEADQAVAAHTYVHHGDDDYQVV